MTVTCGSLDEARTIARAAVDGRLAACAHTWPVASTYRWEGAVERDEEHLVVFTSSADRFDELVLVESNPQACRDAITNLEDCAATIIQSQMEHWDPCDADVVIADPARQGLGKQGAQAIVDTGAPVVVLVSCDPVAGARDARLLVSAGYELREVEVLDIFPETHHVEVISVLTCDSAD